MGKPATRYLINIHYLEIGGAETALIGLLHSLDYNKTQVDLLVNDPRGELMRFIPPGVNLLPAPKAYRYIERPLPETIKAGHVGVAAARLLSKIAYWNYRRKNNPKDGSAIFGYVGKYVTPILPSLKSLGEYDVAISFLTPHNIVHKKVRAAHKACWIHTDYTNIDVDQNLELRVWEAYDKIVSISADVTVSFLKAFPSLKEKIVEIGHFLPQDFIRERAREFSPHEMGYQGLKLLSIGRFCEAKRLDEMPYMAAVLSKAGIDFKWYVIGYGPESEREKIMDRIAMLEMSERVVVLGKRDNPYPYIKAADLYVQPSRYEGKAITVREAQILGVPVAITGYATARSQVTDGIDGFIGPYETEPFARFLADLILTPNKLDGVRENLLAMDFSDPDNLRKFETLFA